MCGQGGVCHKGMSGHLWTSFPTESWETCAGSPGVWVGRQGPQKRALCYGILGRYLVALPLGLSTEQRKIVRPAPSCVCVWEDE